MSQQNSELEGTTRTDNYDIHEPDKSINERIHEEKKVKGIGCIPFVIGGLSFIPLIGVFFGLVTIILGLVFIKRRGWRLIVLGLGGIIFTVVLYGSLFYFGFIQRGGIYDKLRADMAKEQLPKIIVSIEYFKLQNGRYPNSLTELEEKSSDKFLFIADPIDTKMDSNSPRNYYYQLIEDGQGYYLFSSGFDGVPFSEDDILPEISKDEMNKIGYRARPTN